jgi:hypothetical protein
MATTTTVMEINTKETTVLPDVCPQPEEPLASSSTIKRIIRINKIKIAEARPNLPISYNISIIDI